MRSLLIVPSDDPAAIAECVACGADALVVAAAAAPALAKISAPGALYVRVSPLDDPRTGSELEAALKLKPRGVALSGACGGADVQRLGARLAVQEARAGLPEGAIRILAFATESPSAIFGLSSYRGASERLEGLVWSVAPLDTALRASPARDRRAAGPFRLARDLTLLAARAANALALDAAFPWADDLEGLRAEARAARDDGFDGKAAISPRQVAIINAVFAGRD